ncbi:glycoside hydrolase family 5 protein [Calocera cornea HHB12733]|uniref:mannan endo-1,4-beta-mannosidase n=1 Tax=Calocera cornea HHB12733 TaxID=1353952 RepID=A0A165F2H2_9BASI|nr:glycoside hydrolase family 5 protein [Calocera cornea HHB12733]
MLIVTLLLALLTLASSVAALDPRPRQDDDSVLHGKLTGPGPFPQTPPWIPGYLISSGGSCAPNSYVPCPPSEADFWRANGGRLMLCDPGGIRTETVGTVAGPTTTGATDVSKRDAFVQRSGTGLTLLGEEFRIVGPNIYWLGLDENVNPSPSYPSKTRVAEIMGVVSAMGATVIRSHSLAISFGSPLSVMPALNTFNEAAYEPIDFAILMARVYGIKLLIPLVDNYNWYHGGKYQFIGWAGIGWSGQGAAITPPDVGAFFYNTSSIVTSFKDFITHHLTHVNQYTGIAYKDDPTILGWETGNELAAVRYTDGPAPPEWTSEIAGLIKSLAPNHLVVDGTYGFYPESGQLEVEDVDIFSDHFYPPSISRLQAGLALTQAANRVYLAGEWDWTGQYGGDSIQSFTAALESAGGAGDLYWSLFGHDDRCCQFVEHNDGYSFYYPGRTDDMFQRAVVMTQHGAKMTGNAVPQVVQAVACPQYAFPASLWPSNVNAASFGL